MGRRKDLAESFGILPKAIFRRRRSVASVLGAGPDNNPAEPLHRIRVTRKRLRDVRHRSQSQQSGPRMRVGDVPIKCGHITLIEIGREMGMLLSYLPEAIGSMQQC